MFSAVLFSTLLLSHDETAVKLYQRYSESVVEVTFRLKGGHDEPQLSGTAFYAVVGNQKVFLTARHVVVQSPEVVSTLLLGGKNCECWVWSSKKADYAVLVPKTPVDLLAFKFAEKPPMVGQNCYMVGFPRPGEFDFQRVLACGIVNQYPITVSPELTAKGSDLGFSCILVGGYSGSPVFNDEGGLMGMAVSGYTGTQLNFAVSIGRIEVDQINQWYKLKVSGGDLKDK